MKISNGLTIIKNTALPNFKTATNPLKVLNSRVIKKTDSDGNIKIASKEVKVNLHDATIKNKVPIPALHKSQLKSLGKKSSLKPKQKKGCRVTYRMLRKSKLLKKRVSKKIVNDQQIIKSIGMAETSAKLQVIEESKENAIVDKITEPINADTKPPNDSKKSNDFNQKTIVTSVATYSIDSLCNANIKIDNMVPSKLDNTSQTVQVCEKISQSKKGPHTNLCMDNTSKCDPMLSDLSNDLFASLQVAPMVNHQAGCTSPTAAFLLAFPLVSSLNGGKVNQVMDESSETQETSTSLLQIGNHKTIADNTTGSNLLNLDQFSTLFTSKEMNKNQNSCDKRMVSKGTGTLYNAKSDLPSAKIELKDFSKEIKPSISHTTDKYSSKRSAQCLYTYGNSNNCSLGLQNNIYNSPYDIGNKEEKNKFSHTNIMIDNSSMSLSCLNNQEIIPKVPSTSVQVQYSREMNRMDAKPSTINLTYSMAVSQSETSLAPSCNNMKPMYSEAQNFYNPYTPFNTGNIGKDKSDYISSVSTSIIPTDAKLQPSNTFALQGNSGSQSCDNLYNEKQQGLNDRLCINEKNKAENNYQEQENKYTKDVSMRYKPYASTSGNNSKAKRHEIMKDTLKDHSQSIKLPVNWMTTPDVRQNSCSLPKLNIQNSNFNYNNLDFNMSSSADAKEPFFIVPPNENLNTWNNNNSHSQLVLPTTLPTLIGDLALGNTTPFQHTQNNIKQYTSCFKDKKDYNVVPKEQLDKNITKPNDLPMQSNTWSNNFSVSQLVEQYKSEKDLTLQNNERRHFACSKQKYSSDVKKNVKYEEDLCSMIESVNHDADIFQKSNDQNNLMPKANKKYSTEALLSDDTKHDFSIGNFRQQQFFPLVDFSSDIHQPVSKYNKQHVKTSENTSLAGTNYPYPTSTNNYAYAKNNAGVNNMDMNKLLHLSSQNDMQTQSIQQHSMDDFKSNTYKNIDNKSMPNPNSTYVRKSLKKTKAQENNMIDFNYMPGSHSPVFTEDSFYNYSLGYTSNASSQNYQNQNLLYSGNVRSHINQHHTLPTFSSQTNANINVSKNINNTHIPTPSPNITNNSSSLTNFNLSTIFPEMNDKIRSGW